MVILMLILFGLLLGSFVNALVWRIHAQSAFKNEDNTWKKLSNQDKQQLQKLSIVKGRSMCSTCSHPLAPNDLIPVLSWLQLRGKCRYCRKPIPDSPVAEIALPVLFVVSYIWWPYEAESWSLSQGFLFGLWASVLVCFVALAIYDAKWYLLPHKVVIPVTILTLGFVFLKTALSSDITVLGWALVGACTISGIFWLLSTVSKGAWIGGGDINLGVSLGLLAGGPLSAIMVLFLSSLLGTLVVLPSIIAKKRGITSMLPFGPFLIAGTIITFLWGDAIFKWYLALLTHS